MCGIVGLIERAGQDNNSRRKQQLNRMAKMVTHRGPEHLGVWSDDGAYLSQTRLKILDLSDHANQPIFNESGSVVLVFNGEIYNYKELRSELINQGHTLKSQGDSEVIVHLYEQYGNDFVHHLDGMFAFGLWDRQKKKLILARDRTGKKPLYYYASDALIAFGSEIKTLFPVDDVPIEKNVSEFPYYFIYGYVPTPKTLYKNIYAVKPATYLVFDKNVPVKEMAYWKPEVFFSAKKQKVSYADAQNDIRELLKRAVTKRLASDVALGAFLSGGVDSSIVVGIARKELNRSMKTFSIGFDHDKTFDETKYARMASDKYGTSHVEHHVSYHAVPEVYDNLLWHYDGPFGDSSCIPTSIVAQLAKQDVTVVLTGDGGDEVFGGYRRFVASLLMDKLPSVFWKTAQLVLPKRKQFARLCHAAELNDINRLTKWVSYYYADLRDLLSDNLRQLPIHMDQYAKPYEDHLSDMSPLSRLLYLNFRTYLLDDLNVKVDRATMMHALEARSPFLDHHLIEYCATLPDHFFIKGFQTKRILKDAYSDILPKEIYHRPKAGFGVPIGKWFRGPLKSFFYDELGDLKASSDYVNVAYFKKVIERHESGEAHDLKIWNVLMFNSWLKKCDGWVREARS